MKIEILHGRDPDSACELTVFIDGQRASDIVLVECDPGAGHELSSWRENIEYWEGREDLTPEFKALAVATLTDATDSKYIEGGDA